MDQTPELPPVPDEQLASFRRCRFVHRVFRPRDCYRSLELPEDFWGFVREWEKRGDDLLEDTERFEVVEGGWDHELCDVCGARIEDGDTYWPNEGENGGQADLCEQCYPRVLKLLRS